MSKQYNNVVSDPTQLGNIPFKVNSYKHSMRNITFENITRH